MISNRHREDENKQKIKMFESQNKRELLSHVLLGIDQEVGWPSGGHAGTM